MCVHFDVKIIGQCRHDRADKVERKHEANYCTFFRPSSRAHTLSTVPQTSGTSAELNALFGLPEPASDEPLAPDSLFDLPGLADEDEES